MEEGIVDTNKNYKLKWSINTHATSIFEDSDATKQLSYLKYRCVVVSPKQNRIT